MRTTRDLDVRLLLVFFSLWGSAGWNYAAESAVVFHDVTKEVGIDFHHYGGSPQKLLLAEEMSGGVGLIDYDQDGRLDLYFVTGPSPAGQNLVTRNRLYRNHGDWRFEDVTEQAAVGHSGWSLGVSAGDYDGDGWLDLYVTNIGPNVLYRNSGKGTFEDQTSAAGVAGNGFSTGSSFGDYDGDGDLDLFVANYVAYDLSDPPMKDTLCQYRGLSVACGPRGMVGAPDVLYRNNGDGTFSEVSSQAGVADQEGHYGLGALWSDLDNDGLLDLFVANDSKPNYLYINRGNGSFEEVGLMAGVAMGGNAESQACMGIDIADFDGDGWMDIFLTNFSEEPNALYRGLGSQFFQDVTHEAALAFPSLVYLSWGTHWLDAELDGDLDLFVANGHIYPQVDDADLDISYRQRNQLFLKENGRYRVLENGGSGFEVKESSRGVAFGDIDNDGDLDGVVNNMDAPPTLLRNESGRRGNWILLDLRAGKQRSAAVGARARVEAGNRSWVADVKSGGSYLSQNDLRLHFGIGGAETIDLIEIRWPDQTRSQLRDVPVNRILKIEQPDGIAK